MRRPSKLYFYKRRTGGRNGQRLICALKITVQKGSSSQGYETPCSLPYTGRNILIYEEYMYNRACPLIFTLSLQCIEPSAREVEGQQFFLFRQTLFRVLLGLSHVLFSSPHSPTDQPTNRPTDRVIGKLHFLYPCRPTLNNSKKTNINNFVKREVNRMKSYLKKLFWGFIVFMVLWLFSPKALWLSFMALRFYDSMVLYIAPCSMVNGVLWFLGSKSVLWFYDSLSYLITWLLAQMKHTVGKYKRSNITVSMLFPIFGDVTSVLLSEHLLFSAFIFIAYIFPRRHFRLRRSRAPKENTRTFQKKKLD